MSRTVPAAPLPRESGPAAPPTLHSSRSESPPPTTAGRLVTPAAQAPASPPASASCRCESSAAIHPDSRRSEEHTSELQSLMRISYAVFCLKKTKLLSLILRPYPILYLQTITHQTPNLHHLNLS